MTLEANMHLVTTTSLASQMERLVQVADKVNEEAEGRVLFRAAKE